MTDLIEVRACNLIGAPLDWAVAVVERGKVYVYPDGGLCPPEDSVQMNDDDGSLWISSGGFHPKDSWSPSTYWSQGGPLIDKHNGSVTYSVHLLPADTRYCAAPAGSGFPCYGPTALVAFCRSLVKTKLGDIVQVPKELMQ